MVYSWASDPVHNRLYDPMSQELYRQLPAIEKWLSSATGVALSAEFSPHEVATIMRGHLTALREMLRDGLAELPAFDSPAYAAVLRSELLQARLPSLRRVINATGIIIHTNLGRAPLAEEAIAAIDAVARGYSNLELDFVTGQRGHRNEHVESLLQRLTGAEAALVVNNCAAAVVLAIDTLARDRDVVISRGELVEIGGSFRIPDIIAKSGARMVEVGTTNKTRLSDYDDAISGDTRLLLAVHPSNYRVVGFSGKPSLAELAQLAHRKNLVAMQDLGSGACLSVDAIAAVAEQTVQEALAADIDLVTFSGDKLLGGPQAGIIVGKSELIAAMKKNPMLRMLRIDKLSLAALTATLRLYFPPYDPLERVPVLRMIAEPKDSIERRAQDLLAELKKIAGVDGTLVDDVGYAGGGSLPMAALPTTALHLTVAGLTAGELAQKLRAMDLAVIGRVVNDRFAVDPRTVSAADCEQLIVAFRKVAE
ncbi:MAG: L-seryl-tRNA(Sec) selenium transferase [Gammaproteobacteria bacterium]|nr:L-seryl-tRNA(Sec) selenium transferase [Gammaproteobacteria bacterium]